MSLTETFLKPGGGNAIDFVFLVPPLFVVNYVTRDFGYKFLYRFADKFIRSKKGDEYAKKVQEDVNKFAIKAFDYMYHVIFAFIIYFNFRGRDWYDPFSVFYKGTISRVWEENQNPNYVSEGIEFDFIDKIIYNFFIGYRLSEVTFHFLKDGGAINDLCIHHWIAVYLFVYLYLKGYLYTTIYAQQLSMYTTMFSYLPILLNYLKIEKLAALCFPLALISFFYFRVVVVNVQCIYCIYFMYVYGLDGFDAVAILCTAVIVVLTCFWMYVFTKYFVKILKRGKSFLVEMNEKKLSGEEQNVSKWE